VILNRISYIINEEGAITGTRNIGLEISVDMANPGNLAGNLFFDTEKAIEEVQELVENHVKPRALVGRSVDLTRCEEGCACLNREEEKYENRRYHFTKTGVVEITVPPYTQERRVFVKYTVTFNTIGSGYFIAGTCSLPLNKR